MFKHDKISPKVFEGHQLAGFRLSHSTVAFNVCSDYVGS
jgi:hypothetical protein